MDAFGPCEAADRSSGLPRTGKAGDYAAVRRSRSVWVSTLSFMVFLLSRRGLERVGSLSHPTVEAYTNYAPWRNLCVHDEAAGASAPVVSSSLYSILGSVESI